jgi:hypothetical protein
MQYPRDYSDLTAEETAEEIHRYLEMWRDQEGYSDVNLMLDKGLTDLAAYTLLNAGAIDSENCVEWATATEREIEKLVKAYKPKDREKDLKLFWEGTKCWIDESNEHYFINEDVHFVSDTDLREWGFKPSEEVNG